MAVKWELAVRFILLLPIPKFLLWFVLIGRASKLCIYQDKRCQFLGTESCCTICPCWQINCGQFSPQSEAFDIITSRRTGIEFRMKPYFVLAGTWVYSYESVCKLVSADDNGTKSSGGLDCGCPQRGGKIFILYRSQFVVSAEDLSSTCRGFTYTHVLSFHPSLDCSLDSAVLEWEALFNWTANLTQYWKPPEL